MLCSLRTLQCAATSRMQQRQLWLVHVLVLVSLACAGSCMRHRSLASPSQASLRRHTVMSTFLLLWSAPARARNQHRRSPRRTHWHVWVGFPCARRKVLRCAVVQRAERPLPSLSFSAGRWPQNWHPTPLVGAQDTINGACLGSCGVGCGSPLCHPVLLTTCACSRYSQALIARNASRLVHGFIGDPICGGLTCLAVVASVTWALSTVVLLCC